MTISNWAIYFYFKWKHLENNLFNGLRDLLLNFSDDCTNQKCKNTPHVSLITDYVPDSAFKDK